MTTHLKQPKKVMTNEHNSRKGLRRLLYTEIKTKGLPLRFRYQDQKQEALCLKELAALEEN